MFEIVVAGVNRLIILVLAFETINRPFKNLWNEQLIAFRKYRQVSRLHLCLDGNWVFRDNWRIHVAANITRTAQGLHAILMRDLFKWEFWRITIWMHKMR